MRVLFVSALAAALVFAGRDQQQQTAKSNSAAPAEPFRVETTIDAMGGPFSIIAYGADRHQLAAATNAAAEEIRRVDQLISNYIPSSEWSAVNRDAGKSPVRVSRESFDLIRACLRYSALSEGSFDITVGPLMKVWGFYKGSGRLPHRSEVRVALSRIGYRKVRLDEQAQTVRFERDGMDIDPGGIGKGYAVDRAMTILREYGIDTALISAARSTIAAMGAPPKSDGWKVEIRDPRSSSAPASQTVVLRNESMSTSGNYEKFFQAGGRLYSHIMDPRTGYPARGMLAVSVIAPRAIDSEAWTKPAYILGRDWAQSHLPKGFRAFLCEDKQGDKLSAVRGPFQTAEGDKNSCAWLQ